MQQIFISSTGTKSGQSLAAWSVGEMLQSQGMRIGFFKPFVTRPVMKEGRIVDKDALLMKEYFHLEEELESLCPITPEEIPADEVTREEQLRQIEKSYQLLSDKKDALIIMGSEQVFYESESRYLPDGKLINRFECPVLLVDRFQNESMSMYSVLAIDSFLEQRVKIVIINQIPSEKMESAYHKLVPFFQRRGSPIVFLLPQDQILSSLTVRNIVDIVQGEVLAGKNRLENLVESTSISSSHLKGSLNIFGRIYNKIILLGPNLDSRPQPVLAPAITGILLTGGRKPAPIVINTCEDLGIPLIVPPHDNFATMEKIQKQNVHVTHEDGYKLKRFLELLGSEKAIRKILKQIT